MEPGEGTGAPLPRPPIRDVAWAGCRDRIPARADRSTCRTSHGYDAATRMNRNDNVRWTLCRPPKSETGSPSDAWFHRPAAGPDRLLNGVPKPQLPASPQAVQLHRTAGGAAPRGVGARYDNTLAGPDQRAPNLMRHFIVNYMLLPTWVLCFTAIVAGSSDGETAALPALYRPLPEITTPRPRADSAGRSALTGTTDICHLLPLGSRSGQLPMPNPIAHITKEAAP